MTLTADMNSSRDTPAPADSTSRVMRGIGYALSGFSVLFLVMDMVMKLLALPIVLQSTGQLGYPATADLARTLGVILLVCTALYVYPRTSVLGAVLLTGYLGGAVASHLRVGSPLFTHTLFGVFLGLFVWGGLFLRDARLRAVFPWRRKTRHVRSIDRT
jgi:DoxX-like family